MYKKNMKKIFLLLCLTLFAVVSTQAKKIYADLSQDQAIGNGTWVAEDNTFSWTASNNARMVLKGLEGDLTSCTSLVLETSDYTDSWRVDFVCSDENSTVITASNANGCKFYSAGTKTIDLLKAFGDKASLLSQIKEVRVNTNSGAGSLKIAAAYLVQPMTALDFGSTGVALLDLTDLVASGATYNDGTGVLSKDTEKDATLSVVLPTEGIDMTKVAKIEVEYEGDDLAEYLLMENAAGDRLAKAYTSKYKLDFTNAKANAAHVAKMQWNIKANGTMTIKTVKFYSVETTGIKPIGMTTKEQAHCYNLQGAEVSNQYKGIVIVNGKKYVRR